MNMYLNIKYMFIILFCLQQNDEHVFEYQKLLLITKSRHLKLVILVLFYV